MVAFWSKCGIRTLTDIMASDGSRHFRDGGPLLFMFCFPVYTEFIIQLYFLPFIFFF